MTEADARAVLMVDDIAGIGLWFDTRGVARPFVMVGQTNSCNRHAAAE